MRNNSKNLYIRKISGILPATLLAGIFLLLVPACELNSVLDKKPTDSYSDAAVWDDPALAEAFANGAYDLLPFGFQRQSYRLFPYSNMCDEANSRNSLSTIGVIVNGNQTPSYSGPLDVWTNPGNDRSYWEPITQANKFLDKIESSKFDETLKARLKSEMRVVRAWSYFQLLNHYGGVPLITKSFSLEDDFKVARNSYDEVMNFIIKELDESMGTLPLDYNSSNKGRVTKGAAMAIKARALLYAASPLNNPGNDKKKWQAAADAAKAIIDLNQYELHNNYKALFTETGGYKTKEVIWGRPMNINVEIETGALVERLLYPNGWAGYGHSHPIQNLIDDYETLNGLLPEEDPEYDPQNPYKNRDPRFYATILYDGAPFKERTIETFLPGGLDTPDGIESAWNATETSYYIRKFIDESKCGCNSTSSGSSSPTWIWFRYGEVLLNYAEAMYNLGNEAVCREYLNKVRSRPGVNMPPVTQSGQALWNRIVNERRIELVFEEHRFFDVRRWKIAPAVLNEVRTKMIIHRDPETGKKTYEVAFYQTAKFNEWNYLAPIPQEVIDQNSNIKQNPGY